MKSTGLQRAREEKETVLIQASKNEGLYIDLSRRTLHITVLVYTIHPMAKKGN
jgi:hypothetical protein